MATAKIKSWIEGFKGMGIEVAILKTAQNLNLNCTTNVKKGWLFETVFFEVEGDIEKLKMFKSWMEEIGEKDT